MTNRNQICLISSLYPPEVLGGAEKYVERIAKGLQRRGWDVSIIATESTKSGSRGHFTKTTTEEVDVHRITPLNLYSPIDYSDQSSWKKPFFHLVDLWNPQTYLLTKRRINEINPDIVHTHNYEGLSPSIFSAASDWPLVHTLHDYHLIHIIKSMYSRGEINEPGFKMKPYHLYNKFTVEPHVDYVTAPSDFIIEKHESYGLFEDTPCERVQLGLSTDTIEPSDKSNDEDFRVLYVGQISSQKGVQVLVDAFKRFEPQDATLDIVGKGPELSKIRRLSNEDNGIEVHGFVSEEKLEEFYRRADVTVVPSRWYDNSPMVIYESYAHSTPVVGAEIGGIPELITEEETGYLFTPDNPDSLLKVLKKAYQRPHSHLYENAFEMSQEFGMESHLDNLVEIYEKIM